MASTNVPDIVIGRLPIYLRALEFLAEEGQQITSSQELGKRLGISSAQIRKDLSHFGEFGKQGTGYDVQFLSEQLKRILNVTQKWEIVLVGAGDLGRALTHYSGFKDRDFHIAAIFDNNSQKIGTKLGSLEIRDTATLSTFVRENHIQIAIIAVPASAAQAVADTLIEAGVRAILNYAPITLSVPPGIRVQYIDPVIHLQRMTYYL